ncbi:hypothetical protein [Sporosarcina sp. UB5]|uniref:hypothetical protein n=1 Tax=Sporosarcina sp. UB5 TaxID=3047463 RepID=UPI003D7A7144
MDTGRLTLSAGHLTLSAGRLALSAGHLTLSAGRYRQEVCVSTTQTVKQILLGGADMLALAGEAS